VLQPLERCPEQKLTESLHIRPIEPADVTIVHNLVERTALRSIFGDLEDQGHTSLQEYNGIRALREHMQRRHHQWVALSGDVLIGVMEVRDPNHLSMLYVEASHDRQGVGHQLLTTALAECKQTTVIAKITVNSSRYAQLFYARHGFWQEGEETTTNGVISMPMALDLGNTGQQP
jgi:predicted GNAT family N-acyltransferase